ncbi:MAG: bifunctional demethylmenaquinone methyltransferase/2-methoxy-6-polyprenyl-1,4-benzoquinol methylase UbiE [Acidiferrobacteraceae bacterium]|nr:bifunctional demethylmenaquinone methyltransferase/2-methoxy-6-polyprenyl-1,4-benzoquinol methylase UbiE [Acidiferrobacteraceae bacterium]|tara:strand:+ start:155 stop:913 length:759 start_codon:yes stop_codon:yes gene_type:complete
MVEQKNNKRSHFGFREVSEPTKTELVKNVFNSVVDQYDFMNDLMSFGLHRIWKNFAIMHSGVKKGHKVLDVAAGSGDLTQRLIERVGEEGRVVSVDISQPMLSKGIRQMIDKGYIKNVDYTLCNAESLPFQDQHFDCVSISFGLRNITRISSSLRSMFRVLRPGGKILILEFSEPSSKTLKRIYDQYSFSVIPRLGRAVTGDEESYRYLVESIRRHPNQDKLKNMMKDVGFEDVGYINLTGGIVSIHFGFRY